MRDQIVFASSDDKPPLRTEYNGIKLFMNRKRDGYLGVDYKKEEKLWRARYQSGDKRELILSAPTQLQAAYAYALRRLPETYDKVLLDDDVVREKQNELERMWRSENMIREIDYKSASIKVDDMEEETLKQKIAIYLYTRSVTRDDGYSEYMNSMARGQLDHKSIKQFREKHCMHSLVLAAFSFGDVSLREKVYYKFGEYAHRIYLNKLDSREFTIEFQTSQNKDNPCLLYTSPSPRDQRGSRMPSSA